MSSERRYCSDRDIAEAVAYGVAAGVATAWLVKTLGLRNTILLGVAIYFAWKYWDKITAFFG